MSTLVLAPSHGANLNVRNYASVVLLTPAEGPRRVRSRTLAAWWMPRRDSSRGTARFTKLYTRANGPKRGPVSMNRRQQTESTHDRALTTPNAAASRSRQLPRRWWPLPAARWRSRIRAAGTTARR